MPSDTTAYAGEPIDVGPFVLIKRDGAVTVQARGYKPLTFRWTSDGRVQIDTGPTGRALRTRRREGTIYVTAAGSEMLDTDLPERLN